MRRALAFWAVAQLAVACGSSTPSAAVTFCGSPWHDAAKGETITFDQAQNVYAACDGTNPTDIVSGGRPIATVGHTDSGLYLVVFTDASGVVVNGWVRYH